MCKNLTIHEAAGLLGVSPQILQRAVINGALNAAVGYVVNAGRRRQRYTVDLDEAAAFMRSYSPPATRCAAQVRITPEDVERGRRMRVIEAMADDAGLQAQLREVWGVLDGH